MRPLPAATLDNINPPVRGYRYFDHAESTLETGRGIESARNRWLLSEYALLAYDDAQRIGETLRDRSSRLHFLRGAGHKGFAYVADLDGHDAVLAFRGTQVFKPGDSLSKFGEVASDYWTDGRFAKRAAHGGGWMHGGFADSADELIDALLDTDLLASPRRWWIAGHSLGGALALLAASRLREEAEQRIAAVLSFGQPKVGDATFVSRLEELPVYRIVHGCDVVPTLPPAAFGFAHTSREHVIDAARRADYPRAVFNHIADYAQRWRQGLGALTPLALLDHAPIYYATHCYNEYVAGANAR
ncbi:lipase family protein [Arenimonas sp.]|uniref:lipase family protein n=1 Tax=Arenimonas sp. TaxID=1872635 RepID=UPI0039E38560